jgi:hypothetical protein
MLRFSREYAAAQNDAYRRIVLENADMLLSENGDPDAQVTHAQLREWWNRSFSAFLQVRNETVQRCGLLLTFIHAASFLARN